MNRTERKCFLASLGFHLVLVGIMLFASAFVSSRPKETKFAPDFISAGAIDAALGGGAPGRGDPASPNTGGARPTAPQAARPPSVAPAVPKSVALPQALESPVQPVPKPTVSKNALEAKPDVRKTDPPKAVETPNTAAKATATKHYALTKVAPNKFRKSPQSSSKPPTASDGGESAQKQWSEDVGSLVNRLSKSGSGGVAIPSVGAGSGIGSRGGTGKGAGAGGGAGGQGMGDYSALVKAVYDNAWVDPSDVSDSSAEVDVVVVIARSGAVIGAKIVSRSKVPSLNASVQRALDRVTRIPQPFPPDVTDSQLSFTIRFNLGNRRRFG